MSKAPKRLSKQACDIIEEAALEVLLHDIPNDSACKNDENAEIHMRMAIIKLLGKFGDLHQRGNIEGDYFRICGLSSDTFQKERDLKENYEFGRLTNV